MIAAVVVTHSAPAELVERCLTALSAAGGVERIIVVDNGGAMAASATPDADVIRVANDGYGAAANVGFARARELGASACALLNDDVVVRPGWIEPLLDELRADTKVGAVQPKLMFADRPIVNSLGVRVGPDGAGVDIGLGEPDRDDLPVTVIDAFTGGAVVFRSEFLAETGGFDERYFLYYEDVDLAARGRRLGWGYRCVPASVVDHVGSVSTGAQPDRTRFLQERNRLWCAVAHADAPTVGRAIWLSIRRLRHEPRSVHARALAAGLAGAPTRLLTRVTRALRALP